MRNIVLFIILVQTGLVSCQNIVYVKIEKVVEEYTGSVAVRKVIEKNVNAYQKVRDSLYEVIKIEANSYQENQKSGKIPKNQLQKMYDDLVSKSQQIEQYLQQQQQKVGAYNQAKMDSVSEIIKKKIQKFGKQQKYDYILSENSSSTVLYGKRKNDITYDVIKYLNNSEEEED